MLAGLIFGSVVVLGTCCLHFLRTCHPCGFSLFQIGGFSKEDP
jgi:hypothetical protein